MEPSLPRPGPPRSLLDSARAWLAWFGPGRLVGAAVCVVVVTTGAVWLLRTPVPATEAGLPVASTTTPASAVVATASPAASAAAPAPSSTRPASVLFVHVAGAVRTPGVVRLSSPARVADAVDAAGGATDDADVDAVNLAAPLADGQRVYVPRRGEVEPGAVVAPAPAASATPPLGAPPATPATPVDLNRATVDELDGLPGIGPSTAAAIVAHREANGPFATVDELLDVRGIGSAKLAALRELVTV